MRKSPDKSSRRGVVTAGLAVLALAACVNSRGNLMKGAKSGGDFLPHSLGDADLICQQELPNDAIYPPSGPLANGLSAEQQRDRHYQKCMAGLGHPEAAVAPPPPPASPGDEKAYKLIQSIEKSMDKQ